VTRVVSFSAAVVALAVVGGVLHYAGAAPVATFVVTGIALGGAAWMIGAGTDAVSTRLGAAATGVVQSTIGNLPGFFVVLFALGNGEVLVAQTSILGGIFANGLLLLGLAILAGALTSRDAVMRFEPRLPNDTATLLLLSIFVIVLLGLSEVAGDRASEHQVAISIVGALCLLGVYLTWLLGYLRTDPAQRPRLRRTAVNTNAIPRGAALLVLASVLSVFLSSWFVDAIAPAAEDLGVSRTFAGLVLVAIVGNAVPNAIGVALAARGDSDLAISVIKNSVAQLAAVVYPALVLTSLLFSDRLTFVISPVIIGALVLSALAIWQITGDGRAMAFEGWSLVALYVVLATLAWFE
jgi:Ca2+:H+ antiporter